MIKTTLKRSFLAWIIFGLLTFPAPVFSAKICAEQIDKTLLTEALRQVSERFEIFFAYDADLLRGIEVDDNFARYATLEEAVTGLLEQSGLKFDLVGPKYCVIYKDNPKSRRTKRRLERKIRQIEQLENKGDISLQLSSRKRDEKLPIRAISRGYSSIKAAEAADKKRIAPAQVKGTVTDASTGETLIGANIVIDGTSFGASTDLNGEYTISKIPPGTYTVIFSYIGYETIEKPGVELNEGAVLTLDVELGFESVLGEEIIISAQAQGQMAAINQQRSSYAITNIISSEHIQEVPDVNAAESIGRLPGVSLKRSGGEGNKVVVRGLSPQYTIVSIDGVRMTGVDGDRSVGLSIISSEMLDGIELSKSLTPDKDADAIGGVVNLRLREADAGLRIRTLALGGYNDLEKSLSNYKFALNIGNRFFDNRLGALLNLGQEQVLRPSDLFSASYQTVITDEKQELYTSSATVSERKNVRQRSHASLMLDYKMGPVKLRFNNFFSRMTNENEIRDNTFRFDANDFRFSIYDSRPVESIRSHSLRTFFDIGATELNVDVSISDTRLDVSGDRYNFEDDFALSGSVIPDSDKLFAQPSRLINEYFDLSSGREALLFDNVRSNSIRRDQTKTAELSWKAPFSLSDRVSGFIKVGGKYSDKTRSNDTEASQTYYTGGIGIGRARDIVYPRFPDFLRQEDVGVTNVEGLIGANFIDPGYDYGRILDGRYELGYSMDLDKLKEVHDILYAENGSSIHWQLGVPSNRSDFVNDEDVAAAYIMTQLNVGKKLTVIPGVRYENLQSTYTGSFLVEDPFDPDGVRTIEEITALRSNAYWFPSVNLKTDLNDWSDLRAAVYRSASRPDYQFLSPVMTSNFDGSVLNSFNPYLRPSLAVNYDLGFSVFTNKLGLISLNGFHKQIDDLIYRLPVYQPEFFNRLEEAPQSLVTSLEAPRALYPQTLFQRPGTTNNGIPINNPNKAYFTGFEVSWQVNFWYLPGLLSGLVLDLNYSRIWSTTDFPYLEIVNTIDTEGPIPLPVETPFYRTRESRMIDQPADIFNARIGWDFKGFSSRLSFRYQGETIGSIDPINSLLDEVESDQFRIDLTLRQQITERLSFTADVANINQFIDDSNFVTSGRLMPRRSEYFGLTAQFGLRYDLNLADSDE